MQLAEHATELAEVFAGGDLTEDQARRVAVADLALFMTADEVLYEDA
jgi:hypothetical protein